ncbi:MAG: hypothetical protein GY757_44015 [bacterium]|nr:hypothetical protein [bacterium]
MRKAAFTFGLIGALGAMLLGLKWMSDLNSDLGLISQQLSSQSISSSLAAEFQGLETATYLLILCGVTGLVFSILTLLSKFKRKLNAVILVAAGIAPVFFSGKALFGVPMVIAGLLAFGAKPEPEPAPQPQPQPATA